MGVMATPSSSVGPPSQWLQDLIVIDKSTAVYLEEDRSIVATAGSANDLEIVISYEEIS